MTYGAGAFAEKQKRDSALLPAFAASAVPGIRNADGPRTGIGPWADMNFARPASSWSTFRRLVLVTRRFIARFPNQ